MTQHTFLDTTGIQTATTRKRSFVQVVLLRKGGGGKLIIFAPSSRCNASEHVPALDQEI